MYYVIAGLVIASVIVFDVTAEVEPRAWTRDRSQSKATVFTVPLEKPPVVLAEDITEALPSRKMGAYAA